MKTEEKTCQNIKDNYVLDKYNDIWDRIKETLNIKFHSTSPYDKKYRKAKVREFNGVVKANFLNDKVSKENEHCTGTACITIDSFMRMEKKHFAGLFRRMQTQKTKMTKFIEVELESVSESEIESDMELELKSDTE